MRRRLFATATLALAVLGTWQLAEGLAVPLKAWAAQELVARAWAATTAAAPVRPWPWADTWPVARLEVPRLGVAQYVLAGASGRTMAFGPGHHDATPLPGAPGTAVLAGHRDTHFRFLAELAPGDEVVLTDAARHRHVFRIVETAVVDERDRLAVEGGEPRLALVTCWPFDALLPGGPLRYVALAEAAGAP